VVSCKKTSQNFWLTPSYSSAPSSVNLTSLFVWITKKLADANKDIADLAIQELESLLRVNKFRLPIWNTQNTVKE
jgi:V-type H+-transporting ATPase subunit H